MGKLIISTESQYNLYASSSDADGIKTHADDNQTTSIKVYCDNATTAYVEFLPTPSGKKYPNSIAINIRWGGSDSNITQEVLLMAPDDKTTIVWKYDNKILNTSNFFNIDLSGENNKTIEVNVSVESQTSNHKSITGLTLAQYYIAKKGYSDGRTDASIGSWNAPGYAYGRSESLHWEGFRDHRRNLTFTPPANKPNYYVIIAYKGWMTGIGQIFILEGNATSLLDDTPYWEIDLTKGCYGKRLRYSVYGVYDDGVYPSLSTDSAFTQHNIDGSNQNTAHSYAIWVKFGDDDDVPELVTLKWYRLSPQRLLKDNTGKKNLEYGVVKGSKIIIPDYSWHRNYKSQTEELKYWLLNSTSTSDQHYSDEELKQKTVSQNSNIYGSFGFIKCTVKYKSYPSLSQSSFEVDAGTSITIDPTGGNYDSQSGSQSKTIYEKNTTIKNPTKDGYTFLGWELSSSNYKLTAHWEVKTVTVTYKPGDGSGADITENPPYNQSYPVKSCNFTPPTNKYFVTWLCEENEKTYKPKSKIPAAQMKTNKTLIAQWGTPWKKVKWIWIYNPDSIYKDTVFPTGATGDAIQVDHGWERHKPWVNIK